MGELRAAFDRSVAASSLITEVDETAVAAGRKLADQIDGAKGVERTKAMYLMPHLVNVCRELHLTPASREKIPKQEAKPVGKIDELKAKRAKRSA